MSIQRDLMRVLLKILNLHIISRWLRQNRNWKVSNTFQEQMVNLISKVKLNHNKLHSQMLNTSRQYLSVETTWWKNWHNKNKKNSMISKRKLLLIRWHSTLTQWKRRKLHNSIDSKISEKMKLRKLVSDITKRELARWLKDRYM